MIALSSRASEAIIKQQETRPKFLHDKLKAASAEALKLNVSNTARNPLKDSSQKFV